MKKDTQSRNNRRRGKKSASRKSIQNATGSAARNAAKTVHFH